MSEKTNKVFLSTVVALVVLLVVLAGAWCMFKTKKPAFLYNALISESAPVYSLIFVQTGSTATSYYGQIIGESRETITLKNPGYLDVQAGKEKDDQPTITFRQTKDDSLKPLPIMTIYKSNVVFIQELASDSPIVEAYKNIK